MWCERLPVASRNLSISEVKRPCRVSSVKCYLVASTGVSGVRGAVGAVDAVVVGGGVGGGDSVGCYGCCWWWS